MELNESHGHAPIGAVLDRGFPWEAPFSHPSTLEVGMVCAGPEPFTIQAPSGHRQASRRIQRDANGRRVTPLARVSLDESHSIIWGNSGAEPAAPLDSDTRGAQQRQTGAQSDGCIRSTPSMTNFVRRDAHTITIVLGCCGCLRATFPLQSGACLPHPDA